MINKETMLGNVHAKQYHYAITCYSFDLLDIIPKHFWNANQRNKFPDGRVPATSVYKTQLSIQNNNMLSQDSPWWADSVSSVTVSLHTHHSCKQAWPVWGRCYSVVDVDQCVFASKGL